MENNGFGELTALYALGILEEPEGRELAAQLAGTPELGEVIQVDQATFAALAYAAPPVPMPADLKQRLFESLEDFPASASQDILLATPMSVKRLTELHWKPYLVQGVQVARLHVDKQKREVAYLMRAEAGICLPAHRHAEVEEILILEGDLSIEQNTYGQGDYIRSLPGSLHSPRTTGGCLAFVRTSVDDEWLT